MRTRPLHLRAMLSFALFLLSPLVSAKEYPEKPIRLVVPYAAGGSTDQLARIIQKPMSEYLGQPVVVENKPGAGGAIGTDLVAKSAPDGYTLVFGNSGPNAVIQLMRKVPYDSLRDLRPISTVAISPMILAVPADSPARSMKEFLTYARRQGASLNIGSVGNGSLSHLTSEYFNEMAGLKMQHIPYNGGAPLMSAFLGGQVQAAFVTGLDGAVMVGSGKVRYLAVATPGRTEVVPGLPAIAEDVPGFTSQAWFGVLAPKGIPPDVEKKLRDAIVKAVAQPDVRKIFIERKVEPRSGSAEDLQKLIRDEVGQWNPVITKYNIHL
nr:tripartite tricarboxylate transporter substrate binding protein [uncultured Cupriavidus sp.]